MKNHLRPMRRARLRMRTERPVNSTSAGIASAVACDTIHSTLPLR